MNNSYNPLVVVVVQNDTKYLNQLSNFFKLFLLVFLLISLVYFHLIFEMFYKNKIYKHKKDLKMSVVNGSLWNNLQTSTVDLPQISLCIPMCVRILPCCFERKLSCTYVNYLMMLEPGVTFMIKINIFFQQKNKVIEFDLFGIFFIDFFYWIILDLDWLFQKFTKLYSLSYALLVIQNYYYY